MVRSFVVVGAVLALGGSVLAGSIDPPAGPVGPTMKSLDAIEPRACLNDLPGDQGATVVVSSGGTYYLAGDVVGEAGKHGVRIDTLEPVVIDLNGFSLRGVPGSLDGIHASREPGNGGGSCLCKCRDRSGCVSDWGGDGVHTSDVYDVRCEGIEVLRCGRGLVHLHAENVVHRDVAARNCVGDGMYSTGVASGDVKRACRSCRCVGNGGDGFSFECPDDGSEIRMSDCVSSSNGGDGVRVSSSGPLGRTTVVRVERIECSLNGGSGFGMEVPRGSSSAMVCEDLTCSGNTGDGVACTSSPPGPGHSGAVHVFRRCVFRGNGGDGLRSENPVHTESATCSENALYGMRVSTSDPTVLAGALTDCVLRANSSGGALCGPGRFMMARSQVSDNGGTGVEVTDGCLLIQGSSVTANTGAGAVAHGTLNVTSSDFRRNGLEGVRCEDGACVAEGMVCEFNGTLGLGSAGADFVDCPSVVLRRCVFSDSDGAGVRCRSSVGPVRWMAPESISQRNVGPGFDLDNVEGGHLYRCVTSGNGGVGILLGASCARCRVEACCVSDDSGGGIFVLGTGNLVVGCSATVSPVGAYDIAPGNVAGPTVDATTIQNNCNSSANIVY